MAEERKKRANEEAARKKREEDKLRLSYRSACAEIKDYIEKYLAERNLGHIGVRVSRHGETTDAIQISMDLLNNVEFLIPFSSYAQSTSYEETNEQYRARFLKSFMQDNVIVRRIRHALKKQMKVANDEYEEILALQDLMP